MTLRLIPGPLPWWLIPVASLLSGVAMMGPGLVLAGQPHLAQMLGSFTQAVALAFCLWLACRGMGLGLRFRPFWPSVALAVVVTLVVAALIAGIEHLDPQVKGSSAETLQAMGAGTSGFADLALMVTICALAPLAEELLYRGIVLKGLYDLLCRWGLGRAGAALLALLASSVGFAMAHAGDGQTVSSLSTLGLLGLALGGLYVVTGQLWGAVLAHALNNCFAVAQVLVAGDLRLAPVAMIALAAGPLLALGAMAIVHRAMKNGPA